MADYCKEDKEVDSATTEDWMGSSVDPPCFGQSKGFLYKCLTVPVELQSHVSLTTPKSFSVEKPTGHSDCLLQFSFSLCERHFFFLAQHTQLLIGAPVSPLCDREDLQHTGPQFWQHGTTLVSWKCIETSHCAQPNIPVDGIF